MNELALSLIESLPSVPPILLWSPRIEVIQDQDDALGRRIVYIYQIADEQGKVLFGATGRHFQISLANQWFTGNKQITGAFSLVLEDIAFRMARLSG
jgi:hypothetical protein